MELNAIKTGTNDRTSSHTCDTQIAIFTTGTAGTTLTTGTTGIRDSLAVFDSLGKLEGGALARRHGAIQDGIIAITITTTILLDDVLLHAPVVVTAASFIGLLLLVLHTDTEVEGASGRALELYFLAVGVVFEGKPSEAGTDLK